LSYCPSCPGDFVPRSPLTPSLAGTPAPRSAPVARSLRFARSQPSIASFLLQRAPQKLAIANWQQELLRLSVRRVLAAEAAELAQLEPFGRLLLVLGRAVVSPLALLARHVDDVSHGCPRPGLGARGSGLEGSCLPSPEPRVPNPELYSIISEIVPAPTVRPPSRIANRAPFSSATGTCSSAVMLVLSPGITISTPSGSFSDPVTSVVRM